MLIRLCRKGGTIKVCAENIYITAENSLPLEERDYVKLSIKDEGIGISEDIISKIFDPYFTTKKEGSGLGLAISYNIIKKHDGYINVDSIEGVGTTFNIYLPAFPELMIPQKDVKKNHISPKGNILL